MRRVWMQYKKQKTENNSHHKGPEKGKEYKFVFVFCPTTVDYKEPQLSFLLNKTKEYSGVRICS